MGNIDSNSGFSSNRLNTLSQELDNLSLRLSSESIDALDLQKSVAKVTALGRAILVDASREQASGDVLSQAQAIKESVQKLRSSLNEKDIARRILFPAEEAKSRSKQKEFIGDLSRSLALLEGAFDDFEKFGHVIDKFESRSSFPETLASYKEAFLRGLFGSIISSMTHRIFGGHKSQVKLEKGRKEIAALDEAMKKLRG